VHWREPAPDPSAGVYEVVEVLDSNRLRVRPAARSTAEVSYSIGRPSYFSKRMSNTEFFFLDTRTFRELHDRQWPDKPGLSMLGEKQRAWLIDGMSNSDADFLFVVSSVNLMIPHVAPFGAGGSILVSIPHVFPLGWPMPVPKDDSWTVFLDEREQLIDFWDGLGKPVFVLTGDLHNSLAIKITDRVWEFASGPHSSSNHTVLSEGGRPANGPWEYGPRPFDIRWSSYVSAEAPREARMQPHYCVVQVNNVFHDGRRGTARRAPGSSCP